jgi:hypothetical protein
VVKNRKMFGDQWEEGRFQQNAREGRSKTQLLSQQGEMEGNRQSTQTDKLVNRSATTGVTDQPQQREEDVNKASSANSETPANKRYNFRSYLATPEDDTLTKRKGTRDVKGKAFPLQAWTGPWGSWRLRLQNC